MSGTILLSVMVLFVAKTLRTAREHIPGWAAEDSVLEEPSKVGWTLPKVTFAINKSILQEEISKHVQQKVA